ncbi:MAG: NACHT domain-containing protein [Candidatus Electrothrix scaldis]|nr:MAG: NACHT domain-containing protein [Candidatus Electrothrix sp. GW3-3]
MTIELTVSFFGAFFAILVCLSVGFALYFWFRRRRYTRERFAFFALSSCIALTLAAFATIAGNAPPWQQVLAVVHYVRTGELLPTSLSPVSAALIVVTLFGMYFLVYQIFRLWNGQVTRETYLARQGEADRGMLQEAKIGFRYLLVKNSPLVPYKPPVGSPKLPDLGQQVEPVAWRDLARTLLKMRRNMLAFEEEWRAEHNFWLARHRDHGHRVAVLCFVALPEQVALQAFLRYVEKMQEPPQEFILCLQTPSPDKKLQLDGEIFEVISLDDLLKGLIDFSEYAEKIRERVASDLLQESELSLEATYVRPRFRRDGAEQDEADIEQAINDWLGSTSSKQLAILGEYGQGKSTIGLMLTHHLLNKGVEQLERIPIFIELRGKSPATMNPGELLGAWGDAYGIASRPLKVLHEAGRLLLIFDGFDEMTLVGNPQERLRHFQSLWNFNHRKAKLIITGRPNLFLDDNELKAALGILPGSSGELACEAWYLEKFNNKEIERALRNASDEVRNGIVQAVNNNPRLKDIAGRPSLLHVLSVFWGDKELVQRADELTAAELMQRFLDASLERQTEKALELRRREIEDAERGYGAQPKNYMVLNAAERRYFMLGIAVYMMRKDESNQIRLADLEEITEKLARVCPDSISRTSDAREGQENLPIQERIKQSEDFLGRLKDDVRVCGLLVKDVADGTFRFGHKSFLEYLAADYAERKLAEKEHDDILTIHSVLDISFDSVLRNDVVRSYFGELLILRRAGDTILQLSSTEVAGFLLEQILHPQRFTKILWYFSIIPVRHHDILENKTNLQSIYYRKVIYPFALFILNNFCSRFEESIYRKTIYFSLIVIFLFLWVFLGYFFFGSFVLYFIRESSFLSGALTGLLMSVTAYLLTLYTSSPARKRLSKAWVTVCRAHGCQVEDLYAALQGRKTALPEFRSDPIGIFTPIRVEPETYEGEQNEVLQKNVSESDIAWNRGVAAWVLGRRHSKLGGFIFSKDVDGAIPPRDPRKPVKRKIINKAAEKAGIQPEEIPAQLASLNEFLGWDVEKGCPRKQEKLSSVDEESLV